MGSNPTRSNMNMEVDKNGKLNLTQLGNLPTKRLLALLKKVRIIRAKVGFELFDDGNHHYQEDWDHWNGYFEDLKAVLSNRDHIGVEETRDSHPRTIKM